MHRTPISLRATVADELAFIELSHEIQEMIKRLICSGSLNPNTDYDNEIDRAYEHGVKEGFKEGVISTRPFPKINER